jgi:signal transduction histidine kinase
MIAAPRAAAQGVGQLPAATTSTGVRSVAGPGRLIGAAGAAATLTLAVLVVSWSLRSGHLDSLDLLVTMVPAGLLGSVVVAARPRDSVGWSFLAAGLLFLIGMLGEQWALLGLPAAGIAVWSQTWTYQIGLLPFFILVPLYFPDGRLPSRRWRPVARAAVVLMAALGLVLALTPGPVPIGHRQAPNPLGVLPPASAWLGVALSLAGVVLILTAAASLVVRFRSAGVEDRARVKLLAAAVVLTAVAWVLDAVLALGWPESYDAFPFVQVTSVTIVAAAAVSVVRHRLFEVERVLDRALLYMLLTGCVVLLYVVVVALLRPISPDAPVVSLLTAAVVAVVISPLRWRLQLIVDRLVYGDRADPYRALALLGRRLEVALSPAAALPAVVAAVADALHLPFVAIESRTPDGFETTVAHGAAPSADAGLTHVPLVHAGAEVGRLTLAGRGRRLELAPGDRRVLEDLTRQVGVALHAVQAAERAERLSADLQRSRERLVLAREDERRRIGRDLHDGLGPQLAGLTMTAEAARDLIGVDNDRAASLLGGLLERSDTAVQEVRSIAHRLRPPALDTLGLLGALQSQAAAVHQPTVNVKAAPLPALPAAVEVAAYRIASEAIRNVVAHADATLCQVRLQRCGSGLELTVADDGRGLPGAGAPGLGIASMRERAAELGGTCTWTRAPGGGTVIRAVLPCSPAGAGQE